MRQFFVFFNANIQLFLFFDCNIIHLYKNYTFHIFLTQLNPVFSHILVYIIMASHCPLDQNDHLCWYNIIAYRMTFEWIFMFNIMIFWYESLWIFKKITVTFVNHPVGRPYFSYSKRCLLLHTCKKRCI